MVNTYLSPALLALLPLVVVLSALLSSLGVFAVLCATRGRPRTSYVEARAVPAAWKFGMEWWIWMWGPVERFCVTHGVSPSSITFTSVALTGLAAVLFAAGHLSTGGWLYLFASSLDLVDGRVARAQGSASPAGAFLDSTLDRVAELMAFAGLAMHYRNTPVLYAVLAAAGASVMVSYARARGEALGAAESAKTGGMQRAERVVLTGLPCALCPLFDVMFGPDGGILVTGTCLALLAVVTGLTALRRGQSIWRSLQGPAPGTTGPARFVAEAQRPARAPGAGGTAGARGG